MLKILNMILRNEQGILPALAIAGAGALGGAILGGKGDTEVYDPYADLRGDFKEKLGDKLGTSTAYAENPLLQSEQPGVESATEEAILGGLAGGAEKRDDIYDISQKYYGARKSQLETRQAEEAMELKNIYNSLGIVSSTPGLEAQADLMRKQSEEFNVLESEIAEQGISQEMKAAALAEDIFNQYITQGQVLGQTQRGAEQFEQQITEQDIARMTDEEFRYFQLTGNLLNANPAQREYQPSVWDRIGEVSSAALPALASMPTSAKAPTKKLPEPAPTQR